MTIEIREQFDGGKLNCPVCNEQIYDEENVNERFCNHTLFIATSEGGFEYCDDRVKNNLNIPLDEDINEYVENKLELEINELTNKISIPNSFKIVICTPAPGMLEVYYGYVE